MEKCLTSVSKFWFHSYSEVKIKLRQGRNSSVVILQKQTHQKTRITENGVVAIENSMVGPQKIKNQVTVWSSKSPSGYIPWRSESRGSKRYLSIHVHRSFIHNSQRVRATQVSMCHHRWMDKQNGDILTVEYYLAFRRSELLTRAPTWMNLEDAMLNKMSHSQKTNTMWFSLYEVPRGVAFLETEHRRVVARAWGRRNGELVFNGCGVSLFQGEKSSEAGWWGWSHSSVNHLNATAPYT